MPWQKLDSSNPTKKKIMGWHCPLPPLGHQRCVIYSTKAEKTRELQEGSEAD